MKERLFLALGQQLKYELSFVSFVSRPYYDPTSRHSIIDFIYNKSQYSLVLNGDITLKTNKENMKIESYSDLVRGLIKTRKSQKVA
jgi:hypothetical protein